MPCTNRPSKIRPSPPRQGLGLSICLYVFSTGTGLRWDKLTNVQGKAKIDAWERIVDEGVTAEQAQETYAVLVDSLKVKYGFDMR